MAPRILGAMTTLAYSSKLDAKKQAVIVPLFAGDIETLKDPLIKGLSATQKKAVQKAAKSHHIPKSGFATVYGDDALVLIQVLGKKKGYTTRDAREAG